MSQKINQLERTIIVDDNFYCLCGSVCLIDLKTAKCSRCHASDISASGCKPVLINGDMIPIAKKETVNHPAHYGGSDNPYEAIKVIEAWSLGFNLGNTLKYLSRAGKKSSALEDLEKAAWYLNREIQKIKEGDKW